MINALVRFCLVSGQDVNNLQQSDRSRGFGFIKMGSTEEATKCIQELNGIVCLHLLVITYQLRCSRNSTAVIFVLIIP